MDHLASLSQLGLLPFLFLFLDRLQLFVYDFLIIINVGLLPIILDLELALLSHIQKVLLPFFEPERRWNLIIRVQLYLLEDDLPLVVDHVPETIHQVPSPVHSPLLLIQQLTLLSLQNDEVAKVIDLELSHDVC